MARSTHEALLMFPVFFLSFFPILSLLMSLAFFHPSPFQLGFCIFRLPSPNPARTCSKKKIQMWPCIRKSVSFEPPIEMQGSDAASQSLKSSGTAQGAAQERSWAPGGGHFYTFLHTAGMGESLMKMEPESGQAEARFSQLMAENLIFSYPKQHNMFIRKIITYRFFCLFYFLNTSSFFLKKQGVFSIPKYVNAI